MLSNGHTTVGVAVQPRVRAGLVAAGVLVTLVTGCGSGGEVASSESVPATERPSVEASNPSVTATGTPSTSPSTSTTARPIYLALGDSLTAGYQRGTGDNKSAAYPALVATALAARGRAVEVVNLACTGETTTTLVTGGRCFTGGDSQLARAEATVRDHPGQVALLTVYIGANDVLGCVGSGVADQACLQRGHDTYAANLPTILTRLRVAAGPDVPILALSYYDVLAQTVAGRTPDATFKAASAAATADLNTVITSAVGAVAGTVVDARAAIEGPGASELCQRTLVCSVGDIHLSAAGNAALAEQVVATLPAG